MNSTQKIIKYGAIAFAIALIIGIFNFFTSAILELTFFFDGDSSLTKSMIETRVESTINKIEINLKATSIEIKEGSEFLVSTNNKKIEITENDNCLTIKETGQKYSKNAKLIIYLPTGNSLTNLSLDGGAGQVSLNDITTDHLKLQLGAGNSEINNLTVKNSSSIEGGAGNLSIYRGRIKNLDLDLGVGNVTIEAELLGQNKIEAGIGNLNVNLLGKKDNYQIKATKGIGKITINDASVKADTTFGNGDNYLNLNGGIGNITVSFK